MMNGILGVVLFAAFWAILHFMRQNTLQRGRLEEQNKAMKGMLDENLRVKIARDTLAHNHALRDELRHRNDN